MMNDGNAMIDDIKCDIKNISPHWWKKDFFSKIKKCLLSNALNSFFRVCRLKHFVDNPHIFHLFHHQPFFTQCKTVLQDIVPVYCTSCENCNFAHIHCRSKKCNFLFCCLVKNTVNKELCFEKYFCNFIVSIYYCFVDEFRRVSRNNSHTCANAEVKLKTKKKSQKISGKAGKLC